MKGSLVKLLGFTIAAIFLITMVACENKGAAESKKGILFSDTRKKTANTTAPEAKNELVKLSFMHAWTKEDIDAKGKAFYVQLDKYKKNNPTVTIEDEVLPHDAYETKIKILAAANEMPDLFFFKGSMVGSFVENKLMDSVNDILEKDADWKNSFIDSAFDDFKVGDKIYGVPVQMANTHTVYYNKKIFEGAGIKSYPDTWDGFLEAIGKLKAKGVTPIVLGNKGKWVAESCILSTLGDRHTGTDWFYCIRDKKGARFTDKEFVQALTALQELSKMGAFNADMNSIDSNQQQSIYMNGKAAMFMEGCWSLSMLIDKAPKDIVEATELAVLPMVNGGKGQPRTTSGGGGWAYNMNAKLKGAKKEAAIALLKEITGKEYGKLTYEGGGMPGNKADGIDKSKLSPLFTKYLDFISTVKYTPVYDVQLTPPVIEVMNNGLQELLVGRVMPEELAKKIQAEYEKGN
ncbi:MAG: extracellular solute-binding protein [Clostridia bacterium]|nr:extracellular solute-binding protein [Clostridia bacterium]